MVSSLRGERRLTIDKVKKRERETERCTVKKVLNLLKIFKIFRQKVNLDYGMNRLLRPR